MRRETGDQTEQTGAAQTAEYKETGLTTLETNRREPLVDVGCICGRGRGRVGADASLENWRRGGLTMDQPADVARAGIRATDTQETRDGESEGGRQGPGGI